MASTNQNLDVVLRVNTTGFRTAMAEASRLATQNLKTLRAEAERTAAALARVNELAERNGTAEMLVATPFFLSSVEVDFWLALTFSTIRMVTVSPCMRARRSSNSGR